ncbi:CTP synthase [Ureaplasma zalophigenitalium]|uniref:CTP synthase (glutamine hydrolyzing) n=1 Tax=Ureaplasma zalophigenitalium TaxID=907723 RepID=A0ABT3BNT9_9BACT|nr:CTP synthase [Ureaplasma zalophigenitalium]MCV3753919.1 CTP synthase [Ureaplasma zalophigenitalium]
MSKKSQKTKYIFITGGVYSSLGKGVSASSIGRILVELGFKVAMQKLDPYLNVDPTYLSPYQHGEVFVTKDGKQADLDLGTYERFIDIDLNEYASISAGKIYSEITYKERHNKFKNVTVQTVPHVTNHIISYVRKVSETLDVDFVIVEIGGTIGDIESLPFIEAITQFIHQYGRENVMSVHCSPLIYIDNVNELKTKPTQHSVHTLRSLGIQPDILLLRSTHEVDKQTIEKLAWSCLVPRHNIFVAQDVSSVYLLPNMFFKQKIHKSILDYFKLQVKTATLSHWYTFTNQITAPKLHHLKVAIIGQYIELPDAYKSIIESLNIASYSYSVDLELILIQAKTIDDSNVGIQLNGLDAIIIPSFVGNEDGFAGSVCALKHARLNDLPTLVIGNSMNIFVYDFLVNIKHETPQTKFNKEHSVLYLKDFFDLTDNVKFGSYLTNLSKDSRSYEFFKKTKINMRHLQRTIINKNQLESILCNNLIIGGLDENENIDVLEYKDKKYMIACSFNPEFSTRPFKVNPYFSALLKVCIEGA